jgi:hypothetical protein
MYNPYNDKPQFESQNKSSETILENLFGHSINPMGQVVDGTTSPSVFDTPDPRAKSFVPYDYEDGAISVTGIPNSFYDGTYVDFDGAAKNNAELIKKYRDMALHSEVENAIEDICREDINFNDRTTPIEILLDTTDLPAKTKKSIEKEFKTILRLLKFNK